MGINRSSRHMGALASLLAVALVSAACSQSPQARSAKFMAEGKKLLERKDPVRAILQFRNATQATPKDPEAFYQLGVAALAAGDVRQGVGALLKALELNPKHAGAQLRLAQLMTKDDDSAVLKDAQQRLEGLLHDSPENASALQALALTELKLGTPETAMQHLEQAVAAAPEQIALAVTLSQAMMLKKDTKGAEEVLKQACQRSPKSADALAVLGRFYLSQRRFPEAETSLQSALALQPDHGWSLMTLGILYNATGRKEQAEQTFKKLANSPDPLLKPLYGTYLLEAGRQDEAIKEFERLARNEPGDRTARTRLAAAYQATNRTPDAEKLLVDALKKNPKDLDALMQLGELYLVAGKLKEAEDNLNRVAHMKPDSPEVHYAVAMVNRARGKSLLEMQELAEALRLNPAFLKARLDLANIMMEEDLKGALNLMDQAPESQKGTIAAIEQRNWVLMKMHHWADARSGVDLGLAVNRTPTLLLQDGALKMIGKRYDDARVSLHEGMTKAPDDLRILRFLEQSYAEQKQMPAAVKDIQQHAAKYPKSAGIQYFLGTVLNDTGDLAKAREAFASAISVDPNFTPAALSLAQMDLKQSNWATARQELVAILGKGENAEARMWLGMLEEIAGNHTAAIEAFRKAIEDQPNNSQALNNLAAVLGENPPQMDEALKYAQKAKELDPESAPVDDTLGWIFYHKGMYTMAIQYLEHADKHGGTAQLKYHLAMAYLKDGQKDRGRTVYQAALRLNPNLPEAKAVGELLR